VLFHGFHIVEENHTVDVCFVLDSCSLPDRASLNEVVYAERWQVMLEVLVQWVYNLGNCIPVGLVKLEFVGNEIINCRPAPEANIFKKRFY